MDPTLPTPHQHTIWPGLLLSGAVAYASLLLQHLEMHWLGHAWLEGLVIAILLGTLIRSLFGLHAHFHLGVHLASKQLLEFAIMLLGASISLALIRQAGFWLLGGIVVVVPLVILLGYSLGRLLGLPDKLAMLVACGNAICGNSAIVAVAPTIDATTDDIAASIAFSSALGVAVILLLPLLQQLIGLDAAQYGILCGMTVYAVPQALAAAAIGGPVSTQMGTLTKLARVLMLGPSILFVALIKRGHASRSPKLSQLVPWFLIGFIALIALRSLGVIPAMALPYIQQLSSGLTLLAMAALGLTVNLRTVMHGSGRVLLTGTLALLLLGGISLGMLFGLPVGQ